MKRRFFCQSAGSTLAAVGLSQINLRQQGDRYGKAWAQGSRGRKLALLVGINAYPDGIPSLDGCLTDIEMQRELLVHRFGFNPRDVLVVSDESELKPTRQTILEAFEQHLIRQAKPNDVVVFHYSGHGALIHDPLLRQPLPNWNGEPIITPNGQPASGTLVPVDRSTATPGEVQDIMGRTLFLLTSAMPTDSVTLVLDSCHSGGGLRGNLRLRALSGNSDAQPGAIELDYQRRWMARLNLSEAELDALRRKGIAKGVAMGSAQYNQWAADAPFDEGRFYAGAFTYLLTRYLWQESSPSTVTTVFGQLARSTKEIAYNSNMVQEPLMVANPVQNGQQLVYFLPPVAPDAEAVVQAVTQERIEYWLGGVAARNLPATGAGALFSVLDPTSGQEIGQVEQLSRQGLVGYGRLRQGQTGAIRPGMLLREQVRRVPANLKLRLALDPSLGSAVTAAQTALQAISRVEVVKVAEPADYLLGRMQADYLPFTQLSPDTGLPLVNRIGLFLPGLQAIAPTFGPPNESVTDAIKRLQPRFKSLLAGQILKLMAGHEASTNSHTPGFQLTTTLAPVDGTVPTQENGIWRFRLNTEMQVSIRNDGAEQLYVAVLFFSGSGQLTVLYPYWDAPDEAAVLQPNQELKTPQAGDGYQFMLRPPAGLAEVLVLASKKPINSALSSLKEIARDRGVTSRTPVSLREDEPLDVMNHLLENLDRNTRSEYSLSQASLAVSTAQFATISMLLETVD